MENVKGSQFTENVIAQLFNPGKLIDELKM